MTTTASKKPRSVASEFHSLKGEWKKKNGIPSADYDMTKQSRFVRRRTGVAARGSGPDYHFRSEGKYYEAIEQARDMDRNDPLVGILAERRVDNIVQGGFTLDPKTGDKKLDLDLYQRWQAESNDADLFDIAGELTWHEIERQCVRSESIDGDIVVVGTEDGPFQLIEAHAIQTATSVEDTFLGVTTDRYKKRRQYWVLEDLNEFGQKGEAKPINVRDEDGLRQLFHVYNPRRVLQTRGVTQLAPIFAYSGMLEDINFAKLVQQQVVSCFAVFRKLAAGSANLPSVTGYGDSQQVASVAGSVRQLEGVSPGMEITGNPGEELQGFSPNVPNSEYFQQVRLIMQIIGVNFGLPLCLVLMDGSETNFSGWRGAVDEARKGFITDQMNLVRRLHRPAYTWKVTRWMQDDPALKKSSEKKGVNIFGHNWNLPTWSYIEPVADAEGDATQLRNALTSPRRLHAARGRDWEVISDETSDDNAYAIANAMKKAAELNTANPTQPPITWRDLIGLPMPEGQTIALQDPAAIESQAANAAGAGQPEKAGAEMVGLKRTEFKNSRKAINDILQEMIAGTISEQRARIELDSIGVPATKADAYIVDARDGQVDPASLPVASTSKPRKKKAAVNNA